MMFLRLVGSVRGGGSALCAAAAPGAGWTGRVLLWR